MFANYRKVAEYHGYQLLDIYHKLSHEDLLKILSFWQRNDAMPAGFSCGELIARAGQAVLAVVRDGEIVAVTSAHVGSSERDAEPYYFYRKFVARNHRIYLLWRTMLAHSYAILKHWEPERLPRKPAGVLVVPDTPKLARRSVRRAGNKIGFFVVDYQSDGVPIYGRKFDESVVENLAEPEGVPN